MRRFDKAVAKLAKENMPITEFKQIVSQIDELSIYEDLEQFNLLGLPIVQINQDEIALKSRFTPLERQKFCIVDIECNVTDPEEGQIIELGAVMVQDFEVVGQFNSLVHATFLPPIITELTGIKLGDLVNAPSLKGVLAEFKLFLHDAIFVAHNAGFDYNFISASFEKYDLGPLLNRRICTIDLAQKTIPQPRYGLSFLQEVLGIECENRHRALDDAKVACEIFFRSLKLLPSEVISGEDLVYFAKPNPKKRKKKEA